MTQLMNSTTTQKFPPQVIIPGPKAAVFSNNASSEQKEPPTPSTGTKRLIASSWRRLASLDNLEITPKRHSDLEFRHKQMEEKILAV